MQIFLNLNMPSLHTQGPSPVPMLSCRLTPFRSELENVRGAAAEAAARSREVAAAEEGARARMAVLERDLAR